MVHMGMFSALIDAMQSVMDAITQVVTAMIDFVKLASSAQAPGHNVSPGDRISAGSGQLVVTSVSGPPNSATVSCKRPRGAVEYQLSEEQVIDRKT